MFYSWFAEWFALVMLLSCLNRKGSVMSCLHDVNDVSRVDVAYLWKRSDAVQPRRNWKIIGELEDDVILDQEW